MCNGEERVHVSAEAGNSDFYKLDIQKHHYINIGSRKSAPPKPIMYAELDLVESDEPGTPSPRATKSYVAIDFEKTLALSQAVNYPVLEEEEEGIRRTRHNSNLDA